MEARLDICFDLAFRLLSYRRTAAVVTFLTFRFSARIVYGMLQFSGRSPFAAYSGVTGSVLPICFAQFGDVCHITISFSSNILYLLLVTCWFALVV
jgi:hypothetical protein